MITVFFKKTAKLRLIPFILIVHLALVVACTKKVKTEESNTLNVAIMDLHYDYSWDIHRIRGLYTHLISFLIAEPPIRVRADGSYYPSIFKSWAFSEDKKTLTVEISSDFTFGNGEKIDAESVLYSLKKALDTKSKKGGHNDLTNFLCDENDCKIEIIGKNKLKFKFKKYANAIIPTFTLPELSIFPASYYTSVDKKKVLGNLSGPYKVVSFTEKRMELVARPNHHLIRDSSPKRIVLHEIKTNDEAEKFFNANENPVVLSTFANRAAELHLPNARVKVLPPLMAEVVQLNRYSKRFRNKAERKKVASKLYHSLKAIDYVKKYTISANQYFPSYSIAHIEDERVKQLYQRPLSKREEKLKISTYDELGFGKFFDRLKKVGAEYNLEVETEVLSKSTFFTNKNSKSDEEEQVEAFYYFSGVGASDPIFELIYMIERTNGGRYATPEITRMLEKAKYEKNRKNYIALIKKINESLLSEYLIIPIRHSSPVFHFKGAFRPVRGSFSNSLDFWDWTEVD